MGEFLNIELTASGPLRAIQIFKNDMSQLLDYKGTDGFLSGHVIDAFIGTFIPFFTDVREARVEHMYVPTFMTGINCKMLKEAEAGALALATIISCVLHHASHFAYMRIHMARGEVVLYDTLDIISKAFALDVITACCPKRWANPGCFRSRSSFSHVCVCPNSWMGKHAASYPALSPCMCMKAAASHPRGHTCFTCSGANSLHTPFFLVRIGCCLDAVLQQQAAGCVGIRTV
eukprot:1726166-Prymnesium_polylepis.2